MFFLFYLRKKDGPFLKRPMMAGKKEGRKKKRRKEGMKERNKRIVL